MEEVEGISPSDVATLVRSEKALVVDARTFCEYNTCHILNAINVWCSKLRKKRLQHNANSVFDYLQQASHMSIQDGSAPNEVVVYDQNSQDVTSIVQDSFVYVLIHKLTSAFKKVFLMSGGFLQFQALFPELCEDSTQKMTPLTSLSQPCMPVAKSGFTRILPFLFLGSQYDANNKQVLMEHNILYELNVSTSCAKPDFLQESHFMRIAVNDSFSEKLIPHFGDAFRFIDKVREAGGRVLVHCLAGISRSPTVAIAYVMKHLQLHFDEAYRYVKKRRPTISPNINFVGQLLELDKQLLGQSSLYRSPTTPLYLEYDLSSTSDMQPSPESLILKSSSSSCLETNKKETTLSSERSLPSLKLFASEDSSEETFPPKSPENICSLAPLSLDAESASSSCPRKSPPLSAETLCSLYSRDESDDCKTSDNKFLSTSSNSSGKEVSEHLVNMEWDSLQSRKLRRSVSSGSESRYMCEESALTVNKTDNMDTSRLSDVIKTGGNSENYSTTALINVSCPDQDFKDTDDECRRKSICVIEVTDEMSPVTFIHKDPKPMIVRETPVLADPSDEETPCLASSTTAKPLKIDSPKEINVAIESKRVPLKMEKSNSLPATKSKPPMGVPPLSDSNPSKSPPSTSGSILTSPSKQSISSHSHSKRIDSKHLPRSYSSSETHLNTRRLLESQASTTAGETRKSFSTDEVSKAWSHQSSPQTPYHPHHAGPFSKEDAFIPTSPSELARCDSWSTSGLGSEISDGDSQQGDVQMMLLDDHQGPYDAVFADVYPGEDNEVIFRDSFLSLSSFKDYDKMSLDQQGSQALRTSQRPPQRPSSQNLCLKSQRGSKETLGGGSTPRPVSLPGVTGTYNVCIKGAEKSSSMDMGVELEESPDWQSEKGHEIFRYEPSKGPVQRKDPLVEHSPVSSRTMGADVKHTMTWFKIEPMPRGSRDALGKTSKRDQRECVKPSPVKSPQNDQNSSSSKENNAFIEKDAIDKDKEQNATEIKVTRTSQTRAPKDPSCSTKPKIGSYSLSESKAKSLLPTIEDLRKNKPFEDVPFSPKSFSSIEEQLNLWDSDFKRKVRNIQKHASLKSWDATSDESFMEAATKTESTRFSELMQSVENIFESEFKDIKRRADVFRDRLGLDEMTPKSSREDCDQPRSINVTFRPCVLRHHNQSPFFKNPNRASITLPINFTISDLSPTLQSKKENVCKPLQDRTNTHIVSKETRARSEPPLCGDEGLYRVRSCPGLQAKLDGTSKDSSPKGKGLLCVTLRPRPSHYHREPLNRYSWTAPPDDIAIAPPPFESCPDISKLKSFLLDSTSSSPGNSSSPCASSSRLLPVS